MAHLALHRIRIVDRRGDGRLEVPAKALAQAVDGDLHGALVHAEPRTDLRVARVTLVAPRQERVEHLEQVRLARTSVLGGGGGEGLVQQRHRPAPVEQRLRGLALVGFLQEASLRAIGVDRQVGTAPLLPRLPPVHADAVALQHGEQEGAQLALRRVGGRQRIALEQPGEESLREVLGVRRRDAIAAKEGIDRVPVDRTQLLQRAATLVVAEALDERPSGSGEVPAPGRWIV